MTGEQQHTGGKASRHGWDGGVCDGDGKRRQRRSDGSGKGRQRRCIGKHCTGTTTSMRQEPGDAGRGADTLSWLVQGLGEMPPQLGYLQSLFAKGLGTRKTPGGEGKRETGRNAASDRVKDREREEQRPERNRQKGECRQARRQAPVPRTRGRRSGEGSGREENDTEVQMTEERDGKLGKEVAFLLRNDEKTPWNPSNSKNET